MEETRMIIGEISVPKRWLLLIRKILGSSIPEDVTDEELMIALIDSFIHQPDLNRIDLEWVEIALTDGRI